jgi:hypothetical protein
VTVSSNEFFRLVLILVVAAAADDDDADDVGIIVSHIADQADKKAVVVGLCIDGIDWNDFIDEDKLFGFSPSDDIEDIEPLC